MAGEGPFVQAASFCEYVLLEKDGAMTVVRFIDRITIMTNAPDAPPDLLPQQLSRTLVIALKSGAARGRRNLKIAMEDPSGQSHPITELPILFEGDEERGLQLKLTLNFTVETEGLHRFDILLDDPPHPDRLLTRAFLRIVYNRLLAGGGPRLPPQRNG